MKFRSTELAALALILAAALAGCGDDAADTAQEPDAAASSEHAGDHSESADPAAEESSEAAEPEPTGNVVAITIADGKITPKPGVVAVPLNEEVTIEITSDIEDEIHVHGYDKEFELKPGGTASVTFMADIPGVFEIETHESGDLLAELKVE